MTDHVSKVHSGKRNDEINGEALAGATVDGAVGCRGGCSLKIQCACGSGVHPVAITQDQRVCGGHFGGITLRIRIPFSADPIRGIGAEFAVLTAVLCADRAEGEHGFDLAVGAQSSDFVADDSVYFRHGYGCVVPLLLLGNFAFKVVVICLVDIK